MATAVRFEGNGSTYTFTNVQTVLDNFRDLVPRVSRMPGADGGFSEYGDGRPASSIGNVQVSAVIRSTTKAAMEDLRDNAKEMADWGAGVLYKQPSDSSDDERFCRCTVNAIVMTDHPASQTEFQQPYQVSFNAPHPYWLTKGNGILWGGGSLWGNAASIWGGAAVITATGRSTSGSATNNGKATTWPNISITIPTGQKCTQIQIERVKGGAVVDFVRYTDSLEASDQLVINPLKKSVTVNGADAFTTAFEYMHPDWFRLEPGSNTIEVYMGKTTDQADVRLGYHERWR
jgi:hypothetical protein